MSSSAIVFLIAALATATVTFLIVSRMAKQLKQAVPSEQRASIWLDLPRIVRQHHQAFPQSGPMLAFWLSVMFLLVWLTCLVFSLIAHL